MSPWRRLPPAARMVRSWPRRSEKVDQMNVTMRTALCGGLTIMLAAGAPTAPAAPPADSGWLKLAETAQYEWQGKLDTGVLISVDGRKNAGYQFVYQRVDKTRQQYSVGKVFVVTESCRAGYGHLYYADMAGNSDSKHAFVRFGQSVADLMATAACHSWDQQTGKASLVDREDAWAVVIKSADGDQAYSARAASMRRVTHRGQKLTAMLYAEADLKRNTWEYDELAVAPAECKRGYGKAYWLGFDGKETLSFDYAIGGQSVGASMAEYPCAGATKG